MWVKCGRADIIRPPKPIANRRQIKTMCRLRRAPRLPAATYPYSRPVGGFHEEGKLSAEPTERWAIGFPARPHEGARKTLRPHLSVTPSACHLPLKGEAWARCSFFAQYEVSGLQSPSHAGGVTAPFAQGGLGGRGGIHYNI